MHNQHIDRCGKLLYKEYMLRFGMCCIFKNEPVVFKRTTAKYIKTLSRAEQVLYLSSIIKNNAEELMNAFVYCHENGIGDFRVNSRIFPLKTHPEVGYEIDELPGYESIVELFKKCGSYASEKNIRTTFHPDQFILLSSPSETVTKNSIRELSYHAEVADLINADVINIHAGGTYGNKKETLFRLRKRIDALPEHIKKRLTLENDDKSYSPYDLLPICHSLDIPLVYDIHHHRCLCDQSDIEETTGLVLKTWHREPLSHISSPRLGWRNIKKNSHADFIDINDFPLSWLNLDITIEIEAKSKELAVLKLIKDVQNLKQEYSTGN